MPPRPRRRAVGPPGSRPARDEPRWVDAEDVERDEEPSGRDEERLRADRPPHHDRGV